MRVTDSTLPPLDFFLFFLGCFNPFPNYPVGGNTYIPYMLKIYFLADKFCLRWLMSVDES